MLKRIKIVTSLLLVLAVFGLLQLTSGGLFFNALKNDKENFTVLQTIRQQQSTLNGSWVALLQTRNTLNRAGIRYMMDQNNIGSGSTVAELMQSASISLKQAFPDLTEEQRQQFAALYDLYIDWNAKINVISRKDIENLYEHHVLHSLGIAKVIQFRPGTSIMDLGTGGGFPGIPLAILFPDTKFHLVDSIGKKVRVATEVANAIGLKNVTFRHARAEEEKQLFDFVVSRAVMPLADLIKIIKKNISPKQQNALPNGLICLKGGELEHETMPFKHKTVIHSLSEDFEEEFFETKKVVYSQI